MARNEVNDLTLGRRLDFVDDKYGDSPGCYCCAPLGGMYVTGRKGGRHSIVLGPDSGFMFITLALILVPSIFLIHSYWGGVDVISYLFIGSTVLTVMCYLVTALSDPGILLKATPSQSDVQRGEATVAAGAFGLPDHVVEEIITTETKTEGTDTVYVEEARCGICDIPKPEGALHCPSCRVCIRGFDHHCPWVGKCVGEGNIHAFWAMISIICVHFIFTISIVILLISDRWT